MREDGRAIAFHVFIEPDAGAGLGHDRRERDLADLKRIAPQIVAVQLDQVEGVEEDALVSALMTDEIERGNAVVIADVETVRSGMASFDRNEGERELPVS